MGGKESIEWEDGSRKDEGEPGGVTTPGGSSELPSSQEEECDCPHVDGCQWPSEQCVSLFTLHSERQSLPPMRYETSENILRTREQVFPHDSQAGIGSHAYS